MNVLIIAPPFLRNRNDPSSLITIPPDGYGGVENVIYALVNGLISLNHSLSLVGAPGSRSLQGMRVIRSPRNAEEVKCWVIQNKCKYDVIHDHSCGLINWASSDLESIPYIATHHLPGKTPYIRNTVFLSKAQRLVFGRNTDPVIPIPVIIDDYIFKDRKEDYYLFMGRISAWKGVYESAAFCKEMGSTLLVAGPSWESEYLMRIKKDFSRNVEFVGNVNGLKRLDLLANASGIFVFSTDRNDTPWGRWVEPGATIVSEAGASGTPVLASVNGCLSELITTVNGILFSDDEISACDIKKAKNLPVDHAAIRENARTLWGHTEIAVRYSKLYEEVGI